MALWCTGFGQMSAKALHHSRAGVWALGLATTLVPIRLYGAVALGDASSSLVSTSLPWIGTTSLAIAVGLLALCAQRGRLAQRRIRDLESELNSLTIDTRRRLEARTLELERANALLQREAADRKEAQMALADRESRLSDAQQIARLGSFHWNLRTQELHWSDELHRIYGEDPRTFQPTFEAYVGHIHPEDRERVLQQIREAMHHGSGFAHDYRIVRPDGDVRWVSAISKCMLDPDGKLMGMAGTCQDISDRKQIEDSRREEALWRRALLQSSRDGIVVLTEDGSVHETNDRFAEMLGYSKDEVLKLNVRDWEADMSPELLLERLRGDHSKARPFESRYRRKDGSIYAVEVACSDTLWEGKKFLLAICRDVTERKRGERMLSTQAKFSNTSREGPRWATPWIGCYVPWTSRARA